MQRSMLAARCGAARVGSRAASPHVPLQEWAQRELGPSLDLQRLPSLYVISEHIPQRQLPRLYRAADCFVLPTR